MSTDSVHSGLKVHALYTQPPLLPNLPGVVSTLVLTARPIQCVLGQVQDAGRPPAPVSVLPLTLNQVWSSIHLHTRFFWSPAPALVVPRNPMPVVTSVSECLVDHVLHAILPNIMTFGEPARSGGFLDEGGKASQVMNGKLCQLRLGTITHI